MVDFEIGAPQSDHWEIFLGWARREGWRVPPREVELFRGPLAASAFVLRSGGAPRGFVTVLCHGSGGWIGNLLVDPAGRGRGIGSRLFGHALRVLQTRGARSVWLTASAQGRPIYERLCFRPVGGIVRWVRPGGGDAGPPQQIGGALKELVAADARVWGGGRSPLLELLAAGGTVLSCGGTVTLLQPSAGGLQLLGPWISPALCPRENRRLVTEALAAADPAAELATDVLEGSPVERLLAAAGFERRGRCDLMVLGSTSGVDLAPLVALASLGSMG